MKKRTLAVILFALVLMLVLPVVATTTETPAATEAPVLDVAAKNLSLNNTIDLLFYVTVENGDANDVRLMTWTAAQDDYAYGTQEKILEPTVVTTYKQKPCAIFYYTGLAAKQMADNIYVRAFVEDGGEKYFSDADKYSILQYSYNKIHAASPDANLVALLEKTLDYGAQAQTYFGYNTDRLANADFYLIKVVDGLLSDKTDRGLYLVGDSITLTANAAEDGYRFSHWTNAAGETVGDAETLTLEVASSDTYTANYVEKYSEGLAYTDNGDGTLSVSGIGTCTDTDLRIPPEHEGKAVTKIGGYTFRDRSSLTSVEIPDSVTDIYTYAFYKCSNLTSIVIGNGVTSIDSSAFSGCSSLTSITIPNGVTRIDDDAFSGCSSLTSITVDSGNTKYHSAGNCVIETASNILILGCKNSVIPTDGSVTIIGNYAFSGCSSLTSITMPDSVTIIGSWSFSDCSSLTNITIPDSVKSIGMSAFKNCSSLTSITIPDGVTGIGWSAFYNCSSLTSITIPDSVTGIAQSAFSGCSSLTSVTIPDSVTSIGYDAFRRCSSLTSVTIGNGVTSIGLSAFQDCSSLTSITIPEGVKSIGEYTFYNCSSLTSITIPDSVTIIGNYAFSGCSSLTSITMPDSVTSIGKSAFSGCSSLTSITVDSGNTKYHSAGNCLIETASMTLILGCQNSVLPIDGSVTSIGDYAFSSCSSLTNITIPDSVTIIGNYAFSGCRSLTSVTFSTPDGWNAGSTVLSSDDLSDTETAATYLKSTYYSKTWTRS